MLEIYFGTKPLCELVIVVDDENFYMQIFSFL